MPLRVLQIGECDVIQEDAGLHVKRVSDGAVGLAEAMKEGLYDAILLDIVLPSIGGIAIIERLRNSGSDIPILVATHSADVEQRVEALQMGASDFLIRPILTEEVISRVQTLILRQEFRGRQVVTVEDLEIDMEGRIVRRSGERVDLTRREYDLLTLLTQNVGETVTRRQIHARLFRDHPGCQVMWYRSTSDTCGENSTLAEPGI